MHTSSQEQDTDLPVHFTPDEYGVVGQVDASATEVTTPLERVYNGYVNNRGEVIYPGINAPEQALTPDQQAELKAVGETVVPAVIDHTTFDQLNQGGN